MLIYFNGAYRSKDDVSVSIDDRGLLFGDGLYEVVRSSGGALFQVEAHLARFRHGLKELGIRLGAEYTDDAWVEIAVRLLREEGLDHGDATVYVQATRGAAPRAHQFPPADTRPTVFLSVSPFTPPDALRGRGADAVTCADLRWGRCDLKTINLLPNVLAKQGAVEAGALEAILVRDGLITEGASTSVFGVMGGVIRTHPLSTRILPGITRGVVLRIARERGLAVEETAIPMKEVGRLEELFLTGTTTGVMPVVRLDGEAVGHGVPGPIARTLHEELAARVRGAATAAPR